MTLDISLSPEAEAKLKERAAAAGMDVASYTRQLVETAIAVEASPHSPFAQGPTESLYEILSPLIAQARMISKQPTQLHDTAGEFAEGVARELRRQGLKV